VKILISWVLRPVKTELSSKNKYHPSHVSSFEYLIINSKPRYYRVGTNAIGVNHEQQSMSVATLTLLANQFLPYLTTEYSNNVQIKARRSTAITPRDLTQPPATTQPTLLEITPWLKRCWRSHATLLTEKSKEHNKQALNSGLHLPRGKNEDTPTELWLEFHSALGL
jgi:hypothetical protein